MTGTMRFKAWLKRMVIPSQNDSRTNLQTIDPSTLPVIQVSTPEDVEPCDSVIVAALRTSMIVLDAVDRDLCKIHLSLSSVSPLCFAT